MPYLIDPVPDMESQKYGPWGLIHDLTCGRYCLKSLLKYWHEKAGMGRVTRLTLPDPTSRLRHWMGYDAWENYQHARLLLQQSVKPLNAAGWESLIRNNAKGPIILTGGGIGGAWRGIGGYGAIGHVVLLIGVDANAGTFTYLDPLTGNTRQQEPIAGMHARIDQQVTYARPNTMLREIGRAYGHPYYTRAHWDMFPWARW